MLAHRFLFHLGKYLKVGLLGYVKSVCLTLLETTKLFCKVAVPFGTPSSYHCMRILVAPHSSQHLTLTVSFLLISAILIRCVIVSHCNFTLYVPDNLRC